MDVHEYQAKRLLNEYGAPIADGIAVYSVKQAEELLQKLHGPFYVVKSQIHAGGRGKGKFKELNSNAGGGVRLAYSVDEVVAHVKEMLGCTLVTKQTGCSGKKVSLIYIESGAKIQRELYLSLIVDRSSCRVTFIVSTEGGMDIEVIAEKRPDKIITLSVDPDKGVTPVDTRSLVDALALDGLAREDGLMLFPRLYNAFLEKDMSLLEINPLIVMDNGHLRVLDAKISFDDNALFRHPDIVALRDISEENAKEIEASKHGLAYVALDGNIGCMVNGAGLAMATMDIIQLYGAEPANFLDVGGGASQDQVNAAFKIIVEDPNVKGILINIFGGIMRCDVIAEGVISAIREVGVKVPIVIRLEGTNLEKGKKILEDSHLNIISADDLDSAVEKIVASINGV
ncbi:MAG: succinyl-CoA synthetase beta subunit [Candidatus Tokpelaia sp. JSC161]|jgi:succinyl-CoA synthetase beta subunit|nr:MAG: succinyl-CoA synthetase beta subunit [Candidatus Tokpelaia sp. JSC161]